MTGVKESSKKLSRMVFLAEDVPSDLGEKVAQARRKRGWTQGRLAEKAKVARASIYRLEAGGERRVRPDTVFRVAYALNIAMSDLVPGWPEWEPLGHGGHGSRTRERRRALGITGAELAVAAGVSEATLSRYERGIGSSRTLLKQVGDMQFARSDKLARALGFSNVADYEAYCRGRRPVGEIDGSSRTAC
jgi:transcriptional regulator with XRE-family HTH domain